MIPNWEQEFVLRSPTLGDLLLNTADANGRKYVVVPQACLDRIPLRVTRTPIPAADGMIPHSRFKEGFITRIAVQLWANGACASGQDLVEMTDDLMGWLDSILNDEGRLLWEPYTGYGDDRMYDEVRWMSDAEWQMDDPGGYTRITFEIDTPFPYAIDATQQTITVTAAGNTITNTGNTKHWPVIKVNGPTSAFVISNLTTGEEIEYDSALPGATTIPGGSYAEIDTFRNTIYMNGSGANLKPGLVMQDTDFWGIEVGVNSLDSDGPSFDVLYNRPWV